MRPSLRNDSDIKVNLIDDLLKQEYMLGEFVYNKDLKAPFLCIFQAAVALLPIALVDKRKHVSVSS
jgi:hypothetical protein